MLLFTVLFLFCSNFLTAASKIDELVDVHLLVDCSETAERSILENTIEKLPLHFKLDEYSVRITVFSFIHDSSPESSPEAGSYLMDFNVPDCNRSNMTMTTALDTALKQAITDRSLRKYSAKAFIFMISNISERDLNESRPTAELIRNNGGSLWMLYVHSPSQDVLDRTKIFAGGHNRVFKMDDFVLFKEEFESAAAKWRCEEKETCAYDGSKRCAWLKWRPRELGNNRTCRHTIDGRDQLAPPCNTTVCNLNCEIWPLQWNETCDSGKSHIIGVRTGEPAKLAKPLVENCPLHSVKLCQDGRLRQPTVPRLQEHEPLAVSSIIIICVGVVGFVGLLVMVTVMIRKRRQPIKKHREHLALSPPPSPGGLHCTDPDVKSSGYVKSSGQEKQINSPSRNLEKKIDPPSHSKVKKINPMSSSGTEMKKDVK